MAGAGTAYPADAVTGSPVYSATQGRTAMAGAMGGATSARPLGGFTGVRPGTPSTIATATSTTWTVTAFGGYIDLESSATNGGYFFSFQSTSTGTVTAAAGSARVDLLYVQIADSNTGDGTSGAPRVILDYQAGTAGAGVPTLSAARAFVLAQINVPASGGGSPTVTWVSPYTSAAGGLQLLQNQTAKAALSPYAGLSVYLLDTNWIETYDGTGWSISGGSQPNFNLSRSTAFTSIPNGTLFLNNLWDVTSGRGYTNSSGVVTITQAGWYTISVEVEWTANASGSRQALLLLNSLTANIVAGDKRGASSVGGTVNTFSVTRQFAASDVLRVALYQDSGSVLATSTSGVPFFITASYEGRI